MTRTLFIAMFLTLLSQTAWAGLFDSYPRGKKGDVIAEMRSKSNSVWKPEVLFFGSSREDANFRRCEEYRDLMNKRLSLYEYRCIPNR